MVKNTNSWYVSYIKITLMNEYKNLVKIPKHPQDTINFFN